MPAKIKAEVSIEVLDCLFDEFDIWAKISDGRLTSVELPRTHTPSTTWPDAISLIIKHFLANGKHIATTHCIKANRGDYVFHWDAKDFTLYEVLLRRR